MISDPLALHIETQIQRELERGHKQLRICGSNPYFLCAALLAQSQSSSLTKLPHLVVVPSMHEAESFRVALHAFAPDHSVLLFPPWDVSPFSGLSVHRRVSAQRLNFLWRLTSAKSSEVFVAPISALLQKTLSAESLKKNRLRLHKGEELPADFFSTLLSWGYTQAPLVEDVGQMAKRGGVIDVFSPTNSRPLRIELFGDTVESLRTFSPVDQRSLDDIAEFEICPCQEVIWNADATESVIDEWRKTLQGRDVDRSQMDETVHALNSQTPFSGLDFMLSFFEASPGSALDHIPDHYNLWTLEPEDAEKSWDLHQEQLRAERMQSSSLAVLPEISQLYHEPESLDWMFAENRFAWTNLDLHPEDPSPKIDNRSRKVQDLLANLRSQGFGTSEWKSALSQKLRQWQQEQEFVLIFYESQTQLERLKNTLESLGFSVAVALPHERAWGTWRFEQESATQSLHLVEAAWPESERWLDERCVLLRASDLLGRSSKSQSAKQQFDQKAKWLSFGDLKPGDCVVHAQHGIGVYDGLKTLSIQDIPTELVQLSYRDNDKLYLPVYRLGQIQKYSGLQGQVVLDKLGGSGWEKTRVKVKEGVRDIARELLLLYAERQKLHREPLSMDETRLQIFENLFPYEETQDQSRAILDVMSDLRSQRPMDRLICGDVGFGKTEVALRAAHAAMVSGKQVAVLAPTTVLTFQHDETFKKRFAQYSTASGQPVTIRTLNRFLSAAETKKALSEVKSGACQIVIGTHRLLSKDVEFHNLGLLIVDEEQKFGVVHKEKLRKLRKEVDTLAMSATPIPRTLNMSLLGIRDLSLITTAPVDRLPIRTFVSKWNEDLVRKGIQQEIARGGQVFFIHNRIQSIQQVADDLRRILPNVRLRVAHGQMPEDQLEKTMVEFFHHEIDVLLCTAIVESGIDNPKANTMFIDQAQQLGLSQLYQLRGRVGRSKLRAYCYLLMPKDRTLDAQAQERLKVLQENTELGSGLRVAQYDLELRGAGEILGESQSGHIDSVGFEMYQALLEEAIEELKTGRPVHRVEVEPEINLRIPALIPEKYMGDVRLRLAYYKAMNEIQTSDDLERIESDLKDQFGPLPDEVVNLLGLMLIRSVCKKLGIRDLSAGSKNLSLIFTEHTPLQGEVVVRLASRENKKYSLTPDHRLNIRMNNITWPGVFDELVLLQKLT